MLLLTSRFTYNLEYFLPAFVINHSKSYTMAAVASWIEYWLEYLLFGGYKTSFSKIRLMGICLILFGQVLTRAFHNNALM